MTRERVTEQIKILLVKEKVMQKDLAIELGKRLGKNYLPSNLSLKIKNGTMPFSEVLIIADILGYKIKFEKE